MIVSIDTSIAGKAMKLLRFYSIFTLRAEGKLYLKQFFWSFLRMFLCENNKEDYRKKII
jgi:hypothetical protein